MAWLGRLTALSKPDSGVKGIIAGDVVRPLKVVDGKDNVPTIESCCGESNAPKCHDNEKWLF